MFVSGSEIPGKFRRTDEVTLTNRVKKIGIAQSQGGMVYPTYS